ncbi:charged multivesicular body protein 3 [Cryptococcus gattii Ru294]|uniref:Late endosome to vacuole transport-related protein, putative n=2 Tax=Cryptococcus gattii TaxID=37769 RepID=E6QXM5_CRYGW|nr:late endosome to vacuole transport-related protein, putative [Cryptococcus gattii WM276]ADV19668.1 late endosome to vacuole transport-related protein, putative [Cryptococcus gattii WM276]KIR51046.1 charged multivesicular body protein 3 [Cryptococcus gattii Ru294]KIR79798.1 charged multivesicular body protein 3 [Cryptococcus gattii EJB2]KIY36993.1 charged multivesicular body protein 3 [Cryptococcus gattii E566]
MKSVNRWLYGPTPEEKVRSWQTKLRQQERQLDKEIRNLEIATQRSRIELKQLAKKNDVKSAKILAREVVRANKQRDRLESSKARIKSVNMQLQHQLSMVKVTGAFQKSTEIMKTTNALVKLPQLSATMREMSMEMMKSGIMEEMMEETLDSVDDEEIEEEADAEVDKVLYELTDGKLGQAGAVGAALPVSHVRSIHKRAADSGLGYSGRGGRGERGGDAAHEKRNAGAVEFMMAVVDVGDVRMKKE